jgi:type III restriction enzyme
LEGSGTLSVDVIKVAYGQKIDPTTGTANLKVVEQNIEDLYSQCAKLLGEGLHAAYLKARTRGVGKVSVSQAKVELWALLQSPKVVANLEEDAGKQLKSRFTKHNAAIKKLPDGRQQAYRKLRRLARKPEADSLPLRETIFGDKEGTGWKKHLYVDDESTFHCTLNGWEDDVLRAELKKPSVIGWLRNPPRKDWSLCIPYRMDGEDRPHYPDLLIFRKQGTDIVCDILEPHALAYGDSLAKAQGLAAYAKEHAAEIGGSVKLMAKIGDKMKALDLTDETTRDEVLSLEGPQGLQKLFDQA